MVHAFEEGSPQCTPAHVVARPTGIAKAILRGDPRRAYPYVRQIVLESNGTFTAVSEAEIREARSMVQELEGIDPCFSASAAVAGLVKLARRGELPRGDTVLVNLTGGERPHEGADAAHAMVPIWLKATANGSWEPEDPSDPHLQAVWPGALR